MDAPFLLSAIILNVWGQGPALHHESDVVRRVEELDEDQGRLVARLFGEWVVVMAEPLLREVADLSQVVAISCVLQNIKTD